MMFFSANPQVKFSIGHKIFASLFLTCAVLVLVMLTSLRVSLGRGFQEYLARAELAPLAQQLEQNYARTHRWALTPEQSTRLAVLDGSHRLLLGSPQAAGSPWLQPLRVEGKEVAWLTSLPENSELAHQFLRNQMRTSALIGVAALALSTLTAAALSAHLRRPIRQLVRGTQKLASGDYTARLAVGEGDELGQLAHGFNHLAHTLERGNQSRKQWIADVSHELRTPLAVLRAEVEALQDGVRPANQEAFELLHGQVMALTALTEDLFQLARADLGQLNYKMREVDLWRLLQETSEPFQSRYQKAGLQLELVRESSRLTSLVWGDADRLRQLLSNLLENSLRYTHAPGRVELRCQSNGSHWTVRIDDSAPGVAQEMSDRLFDRFFRVESSRSKKMGGAGLGLSLCRAIAQAHDSQIVAGASSLGGLRVDLIIPCYPR